MEYVAGATLRDIVHTDDPIEPRRAIEIIADACQRPARHHPPRRQAGHHHDQQTGAVKVMNFGIARALADAGNPMTPTTAVIGTASTRQGPHATPSGRSARGSRIHQVHCGAVRFDPREEGASQTGTVPTANTTTKITTESVIEVGNGPLSAPVPPLSGQVSSAARAVLTAAGFTNLVDVPVDGFTPEAQVVGTVPAEGEVAQQNQPIQLLISAGNEIKMSDLIGQFYVDVVPYLWGLGFTGAVLNGGTIPISQDTERNRVLDRTPSQVKWSSPTRP